MLDLYLVEASQSKIPIGFKEEAQHVWNEMQISCLEEEQVEGFGDWLTGSAMTLLGIAPKCPSEAIFAIEHATTISAAKQVLQERGNLQLLEARFSAQQTPGLASQIVFSRQALDMKEKEALVVCNALINSTKGLQEIRALEQMAVNLPTTDENMVKQAIEYHFGRAYLSVKQ